VTLVASILTPLENVMKSILDFFHLTVGLPWAWAIVAVTIVVRICIVPLTVRQIHSMQAMQAHMPEMKRIQQKYKGDRQKLNEELMKFYKENNINPAASCLPLLPQLPVFFALYLTLKHASRGAHPIHGSWLHVIPDIAAKADSHWGGWVLLAIYAGSQISSTYFMGATMDKTQRNIMMVVPLLFITVVSRFPVGLVIYWMTTNLWTVGQGLITRRLMPRTPGPRLGPQRSSRTPPKSDRGNGAAAKTPEPEAEPEPDAAPKPKPKPAAPQQPRRVKRKKGGSRR
jgi:YidC/Oxa1 family membrane protein insertase